MKRIFKSKPQRFWRIITSKSVIVCEMWPFKHLDLIKISLSLFFLYYSAVCAKVGFGEWGDICNTTEECSDFRYVCSEDEFHVFRCLCDKFHQWVNETIGCIQIFNASYIINETVTEEVDRLGRLLKYNQHVFQMQAIAGVFVFGVVIFATVCVISYCLFVHISDRRLEKCVKKMKKKKETQQLTSFPVPSHPV